jgi:DNA-binding transcriptional MerR regulator
MAQMLTVGEFSQLTHLTVKALHHYHQTGVLEPVLVDPVTGYRYYDPDQVETAHLVRRLRAVRMPLAEIQTVLAAADQQARDAGIAAHLSRLRQELASTAAAVASLEALLSRGPSSSRIDYRREPSRVVLALSGEVERNEIGSWCARVYPRLYAAAGERELLVTGPGGALYGRSWFEQGSGGVTAYLPVDPVDPVAVALEDGPGRLGEAQVRLITLPAQRLAVAVHPGPFDELDRTYGRLGRQVVERGHGAPGPIRELYLINPADTDDPADWRTEVCWPVSACP